MPVFAHQSDESSNYVVVNAYEELVKQSVLMMIDYMDMCACEKCVSDACALVLNQLPPLYVTTRKGELITQVNQTMRDQHIDLTVKVVHALQMVNESPRH